MTPHQELLHSCLLINISLNVIQDKHGACLCVCISACNRPSSCVQCVRLCVRMHAHTEVRTLAGTHRRRQAHTDASTHARTRTHTHTHTHKRTHAGRHTQTHAHTHTHTLTHIHQSVRGWPHEALIESGHAVQWFIKAGESKQAPKSAQ